MSTTAIIAQARMGSSRLPGKAMMPLAGEPVVAHVLRRAAAIRGADAVCLATTDRSEDDALAAEAERRGVAVFRGSADDVLDRYLGAARMLEADVVMRVTCDCPLLDPDVCEAVLRARSEVGADYAANVDPPSWPHGLDCEAFTMAALERAAATATTRGDREHVTLWLRRERTVKRANVAGPDGRITAYRWVLDYPEDYDFLRALFALLPPAPALPGWQAVAAIMDAHPELAAINAARIDDQRRAALITKSSAPDTVRGLS